jgi:hypothetical protein
MRGLERRLTVLESGNGANLFADWTDEQLIERMNEILELF